MIKDIKCDLFQSSSQVIIHQANCWNTQGSGVAKTFRALYPEIYIEDCKTARGDVTKLGKISIASLNNNQYSHKYGINCYSQYYYGHGTRHTNYEAFVKCLCEVKLFVEDIMKGENISVISAPFKMGCALGGGDWRIVRPMFDSVFENCSFDVLICDNS